MALAAPLASVQLFPMPPSIAVASNAHGGRGLGCGGYAGTGVKDSSCGRSG